MSTDRPTLDEFARAVLSRNPFLVNRVDRPYDHRLVDVEAIHEGAYRPLLDLGAAARDDNRGIGVVVWGEAGVGKSHLLARLARRGPRDCFVYLHNLQASPERLPRTVLRNVVQQLTLTKEPGRSPLSHLVTRALKRTGLRTGNWDAFAARYNALVRRIANEDPSRGVLFDRTVYTVLFRYFRAAHSSQRGAEQEQETITLRWLSGEALEPAEAVLIGLPTERRPGDPVALADNQQVKQALVALAQLARMAGKRFVLAFDQVDNLDEEQIRALTRFLHDLLDSAGNALVITTGVRATLLRYLERGVITETSWDRVAQVEIELGRLRGEAGREVLRGRLTAFLQPFASVPQVAALFTRDPLFPLGTAWYENRVQHLLDFRARDLISWAGERWTQLQQGLAGVTPEEWLARWPEGDRIVPPPPPPDRAAAVDALVEARLAEVTANLRREPSLLPTSEDHLLALLESLLQQSLGPDRPYWVERMTHHEPPKYGPRPAYDFTLEQRLPPDGRALRLACRVLVDSHGNTVAAALKAMLHDDDPPARVYLVTDARHPPSLGAESQKRLEQLRARPHPQFSYVEVSAEEYAALEALNTLVRMGRGGDLELAGHEPRTVTEAEVIASHRRKGRYHASTLLAQLLGGPRHALTPGSLAGTAPAAVSLDEVRARQFIMARVADDRTITLGELARRYAQMLATDGRTVELAGLELRLREVVERLAAERFIEAGDGPGGLTLSLAPAQLPR